MHTYINLHKQKKNNKRTQTNKETCSQVLSPETKENHCYVFRMTKMIFIPILNNMHGYAAYIVIETTLHIFKMIINIDILPTYTGIMMV